MAVLTVLDNDSLTRGSAVFLGNFESNSPEWHELRSGANIGGSDVSTICGVNPWESPFSLWAKKTGKIPESFTDNESMEWGRRLEAVIMDKFAENHPDLDINAKVGTWAHKDRLWQIANPDGIGTTATGEDYIIEIKTASFKDDWANGVPRYYRTQVQWYMQTFGIKKAFVAVLFSGKNYEEFEIDADEFEQDTNMDRVTNFRQYVLEEKQPDFDGALATYETIRKIHPDIDPEGEEELGDLGVHYFNAVAEFDGAQAKLNEMKSRVLDAMGKARKGLINGAWVVTRQPHRTAAPFLVNKRNA